MDALLSLLAKGMGTRDTIRLVLVGVIVSVFSVCITTLFLQSHPHRAREGFQIREIYSSTPSERERWKNTGPSIFETTSPPKRDVEFSYYILYASPTPQDPGDQFNGTAVIMLVLDEKGEGGKQLEMRVDVSIQPVKNGRTIGVRRGYQDLQVRGVDQVSKYDIDALRTYTTPTFLYNKTVIDIDSNGYLALQVLFGGDIQRFTFLHTSKQASLPSKQKSMVDDLHTKFELRHPWPAVDDVMDPTMPALCDYLSADVVIVSDFTNFAKGFSSLAEAVATLRCMTNQVLLVQVNTISGDNNFTKLAKMELFQQFADLEDIPSALILPPRTWFAAHTKAFSRPASYIDIRRGNLDPPTFLQRLGVKYPYLGFHLLNPSFFAPRCQPLKDTILSRVLIDKVHEDDSTKQSVATCMYVYYIGNKTAITKISSSDFGVREHWFINKLYEVDPQRASLFVPKSWAPFIDDRTGTSSSCIEMMQGVTVQDATMSELIYEPNDYLQFADDAIEILYLLRKAGIVHRDLRESNIMILNTKRLAIFDFMYSVSADMPFSGFTPNVLNLESYQRGYTDHCDIKGMAGIIMKRFAPNLSYLGVLTMELNIQATNSCTLNYDRLREIMTKIWDDVNFFF